MQNTVIILDRTLSHIIYIPLIISRCPGLRMLSVYLLCLLVLLAAAAQAARQLAGGGAGRVAGRARLLLLGETHAVKREVHVHKLPVLGQITLRIWRPTRIKLLLFHFS